MAPEADYGEADYGWEDEDIPRPLGWERQVMEVEMEEREKPIVDQVLCLLRGQSLSPTAVQKISEVLAVNMIPPETYVPRYKISISKARELEKEGSIFFSKKFFDILNPETFSKKDFEI